MAERGIVETSPAKEYASYKPLIGMQARFVLADTTFLDPDKTCPDEALSQTASFAQRDYEIFDRASVADRKQHWAGNVGNFATKYDTWEEQTRTALNNAREMPILQNMTPLFDSLGIHPQTAAFTKEDTNKIWKRYFESSQEHKAGGVKQFVSDVLDANRNEDGTVDQQQLANAMKSMQWFSRLFGETGGEIVTQLIDAEARLMHSPDFAQNAKNQTNNLTPKEVELLSFLTKHTKPVLQRDQEGKRVDGQLPIFAKEQEIIDSIKNNSYTIIIAGTGTGKTIGIPLMLSKIFKEGDKLVITEPTQINAAEPAGRIAHLRGVKLGGKVGFQHGAERNSSPKTDTLVVTEGILLQQLRHDQTLKEFTHLMLDEAHKQGKILEEFLERIPDIQERRRQVGLPPLKVIVASATIDKTIFEKYFPGAKTVEIPGEAHKVDENFATHPIASEDMSKEAAKIVQQIIVKRDKGDILIAVKGQADMRKHREALAAIPNLEIFTLFSNASESQKNALKQPSPPGKRKVILATDFIQQGITMPDLMDVINTGEKFEKVVDPQTGLEYLATTQQAIAECDQWRGRVGRTNKGYCHNLFTEEDKKSRQPYPTPEMRKSDLSDVILLAKSQGRDIRNIQFLSSPLPEQNIVHGINNLKLLGAIDDQERITDIGRKMLDYPTDLHLARMIVEGERKGIPVEHLHQIAAMIEARDIIAPMQADTAREKFGVPGSDFLTYLNIWQEFHKNGIKREWAEANGLNYGGLRRALDMYNQRLKPKAQYRTEKSTATSEEIQQCVAAGFRDRLMRYSSMDSYNNRLYRWDRNDVGNPTIRIGRNSVFSAGAQPEVFVATENNEVQPGRPIFFSLCQEVKPEWRPLN